MYIQCEKVGMCPPCRLIIVFEYFEHMDEIAYFFTFKEYDNSISSFMLDTPSFNSIR